MAVMSIPVEKWLYSRLHGDATLLALLATDATHTGVYMDEITPPPLYPGLVIYQASMLISTALGPQRRHGQARYGVKAIGAGRSYAALEGIINRADSLLQSTGGATYSGAVWTIVGQQEVKYAENDAAGDPFRHLGIVYELLAPAA